MQPDNVWRIDFQPLERRSCRGGQARERAAHPRPARARHPVRPGMGERSHLRLRAHGRVPPWSRSSPATRRTAFALRRARAANSGAQDAENPAWKLASRTDGLAPETPIDTYSAEREHAADENILNSSRATDFIITPKSEISRSFRNAVLNSRPRPHPFSRARWSAGRLSPPATYADSPLNTPDTAASPAACGPAPWRWTRRCSRRRAGLVAVAAGRRFRAGAVLLRIIARRRHAARAGRAAPGAGAGQDRAGRRPDWRCRRRAPPTSRW